MYDEIRSNLFKQGTKILHSIAEHYENGSIDVPEANHLMMQLFALVAEASVEGTLDPETGFVKWSMTEAFRKETEASLEATVEKSNGNVVKGPW